MAPRGSRRGRRKSWVWSGQRQATGRARCT
jgi:hypothetical protein